MDPPVDGRIQKRVLPRWEWDHRPGDGVTVAGPQASHFLPQVPTPLPTEPFFFLVLIWGP